MRIVLIGQAAFGEAVYRKLLEQQEEVIKKFESVGFVIEKLENLDDWALIIARKRLQAS